MRERADVPHGEIAWLQSPSAACLPPAFFTGEFGNLDACRNCCNPRGRNARREKHAPHRLRYGDHAIARVSVFKTMDLRMARLKRNMPSYDPLYSDARRRRPRKRLPATRVRVEDIGSLCKPAQARRREPCC